MANALVTSDSGQCGMINLLSPPRTMTPIEINALTNQQFVDFLFGKVGIGNIAAVEDAVTDLEREGALGHGILRNPDPRFIQLPLF